MRFQLPVPVQQLVDLPTRRQQLRAYALLRAHFLHQRFNIFKGFAVARHVDQVLQRRRQGRLRQRLRFFDQANQRFAVEANFATGQPEAVELAQAGGHIARHAPQMLFPHHKVYRQVALARFAQAPLRQQLQTTQLAGTQLPGVADIAPGLGRVDHLLTTLLHHAALVERRRQPASAIGLRH
ncbi:Uncharacterised protein [Klebsiella pneumoniae]|nr:Uncharacterised protein [Klebsiella pneumoniae]